MNFRWRKKPVVIDAFQYPGNRAMANDTVAVPSWFITECCKEQSVFDELGDSDSLTVTTLEGKMTCNPGDWIIKGVKGEFYPCKHDIFVATYERAEAA